MSKSYQNMVVGDIARRAHEVNRVYCASIGDNSQKRWDVAPGWQRESAIGCVKEIMDNPHMEVGDAHAAWLKHKLDTGWVYGKVKDAGARTHPCMVPFEDLPSAQQMKDVLFINVVKSFL